MAEVLTLRQAVALGKLAEWTLGGKKVRWSPDDGVTIRSGVLRHFINGPEDFSFPPFGSDVRDQFVRITDWGFEHVMPVREAVELIATHSFVEA